MSDTYTLPAPPALFLSFGADPSVLMIADSSGTALYTFDPHVSPGNAMSAVHLMNIVLRQPSVMNWVIAIAGTFGTDQSFGYRPGSFSTKIIEAAFAGDVANQAKLAESFPEIVAAVQVWQNVYGSPDLFETAIKDSWVLA
ncbi:MAG TPA: hypothetical protein VMX12_08925 [Acidimicrobiia bacterium]|nr:hypothetical protein [Acidimicrobiia bacterium]